MILRYSYNLHKLSLDKSQHPFVLPQNTLLHSTLSSYVIRLNYYSMIMIIGLILPRDNIYQLTTVLYYYCFVTIENHELLIFIQPTFCAHINQYVLKLETTYTDNEEILYYLSMLKIGTEKYTDQVKNKLFKMYRFSWSR